MENSFKISIKSPGACFFLILFIGGGGFLRDRGLISNHLFVKVHIEKKSEFFNVSVHSKT